MAEKQPRRREAGTERDQETPLWLQTELSEAALELVTGGIDVEGAWENYLKLRNILRPIG